MCDVCGPVPDWFAAPEAPESKPAPTPRPAAVPTVRPAPTQVPAMRLRDMLPPDPVLRERLREWRRAAAKRNKVPAYIVMHDSTLEDLCARRPSTIDELLEVSGIGQRRAELYGAEILAVIATRDAERQ
jgi:ATP-dependent DNA helicase RecQ